MYLRQQGCEDPWLFIETKRDPRAKLFAKHKFSLIFDSMQRQAFVEAVKVHFI